jgi:chemotaxis protein MotB
VDRANAVRKKLNGAGLPEERIMKVVGYAATDPIVRDAPYSPLNRRVSIVVKEKKDPEIEMNPVEGAAVISRWRNRSVSSKGGEAVAAPLQGE